MYSAHLYDFDQQLFCNSVQLHSCRLQYMIKTTRMDHISLVPRHCIRLNTFDNNELSLRYEFRHQSYGHRNIDACSDRMDNQNCPVVIVICSQIFIDCHIKSSRNTKHIVVFIHTIAWIYRRSHNTYHAITMWHVASQIVFRSKDRNRHIIYNITE